MLQREEYWAAVRGNNTAAFLAAWYYYAVVESRIRLQWEQDQGGLAAWNY